MELDQVMAAAKPQTPLSVADLEAELDRCDAVLQQAKRAKNSLRTKIPGLMATGDSAMVEECRAEMAKLDAKIATATELRDQTAQAIDAAKARDLSSQRTADYERAQTAVIKAARDTAALDGLITALGAGISKALASRREADTALNLVGVGLLRDVLAEGMVKNLIDMALYVETDGQFGKAVTLDTLHQLRQSGRASLTKAAKDYEQLTLQHAARSLRINNHEAA